MLNAKLPSTNKHASYKNTEPVNASDMQKPTIH